MADRGAHAAHLAVAAFGEHDLEPRALALRCGADETDQRGTGQAVLQRDALVENAQGSGVGYAPHAGVVRLRHLVHGLREALTEAMVVRQDQESRGVAVETSDRKDPLAD